jgi:hypothetical protein
MNGLLVVSVAAIAAGICLWSRHNDRWLVDLIAYVVLLIVSLAVVAF